MNDWREIMRRSVFLGVFVCAVGAAVWVASAPSRQPSSSTPVITVRRGSLADEVNAMGVLEPSRLVQIGARVSGQLTAFHVSLGDEVHAGDLIAEMDSFEQQNRLRLARASLSKKQAAQHSSQFKLDRAERVLTRQRHLSARQVISSAALQDAEIAVRIARAKLDESTAQVEEATAGVEKAQIDLGYTQIAAPIDGRVIALEAKPGQTEPSRVIAVVAQTDTMRARVQVSEADVQRIRVGQPVHFTTVGDRKTNRASRVMAVEPAPSFLLTNQGPTGGQLGGGSGQTQTVYYNLFFEASNKDGELLPMMTAEVTITVSTVDDVLLAPWGALVGPDPEGLYRARVDTGNGATAARRVRVGLVNQMGAEIVDGLAEGEKIILRKDSGITDTHRPLPGNAETQS
ncbi:efflux RND transporter periplasmic adaptor subunit [Mesorhizobium sp. Cs1299R1N3]|uniref:efflux RND transporter periplasmic adaptor subunit n=1 Tax=Mesorhizobium sp. Cs1299R1N3 TaxID=3015173 RepID=UPI00301B83E3